jgi:hypothetical protein
MDRGAISGMICRMARSAVDQPCHAEETPMTQYLVAIHHPDDFDPASETQETRDDISALNRAMIAAGVRVFAGGLHSARRAKSMRVKAGKVLVTDGPFIETKEHIGGFWILDTSTEAEALDWGRKAVVACRAPVEVRPFHDTPPHLAKA